MTDMPFVVPGLDVERGLDVFEGEMDDYMSALGSFLRNVPDIMDKLRRDAREGNLPEYAINVHGLKSISGWICAESIRAGCEELETLARAGDLPGVLARNGVFLEDVAAFVKYLQAALAEFAG
jgi:HPt (histidine-containing phosphotransfer) domain-containing protein